jgi:sugar phosphate isomerase/epimerase
MLGSFSMLQIKLGIELASLRLPLKKALLTAHELGAEAVEIDLRNELSPDDLSRTGIRSVRKMLDDLNLRLAAASFRTRRGYGDLPDLDARVDATKRALTAAYELGTSVVVNHIGHIPPETDARSRSMMLEVLGDIGRHGQKCGAFLAAETGAQAGEELASLIQSLPPGSLNVDFNPSNLIINGHSPTAAMRLLAPHVVHFDATDATRDVAQGRGFEVALGQGTAELPELLALLEEQQYRGYLTISRHKTRSPIEDIKQAMTFLRNL